MDMNNLDPRVAAYIKRKMQESEEDDSPETREKLGAENKEVLDQHRTNNLGALFGQSAAMAGTLHGVTPDAKPLKQFMDSENSRLNNSLALRDKLRKRSEMDPRVVQYLMKEKAEKPIDYLGSDGKPRIGRYIEGQGPVTGADDPFGIDKSEDDMLKLQLMYDKMKLDSGERQKDRNSREKIAGMRAPAGGKSTKGQDSLDTAFAKDYAEYIAGGGYADALGNINQLRDARNKLSKSDMISGPVIGRLPMGDVISPDSRAVQEQVSEVAQRNLRLVLGGQFAQQEGAQLIQRAYNPKLSEQENMKRLDRLISKMEQAAKAKQAAVEYFEEHGTLKGFKGRLPSMAADFSDIEAPKTPVSGSGGKSVQEMTDDEVRAAYEKKHGKKK